MTAVQLNYHAFFHVDAGKSPKAKSTPVKKKRARPRSSSGDESNVPRKKEGKRANNSGKAGADIVAKEKEEAEPEKRAQWYRAPPEEG